MSFLSPGRSYSRAWSPADDGKLAEIVQQQHEGLHVRGWREVAKNFGDSKTLKSCRLRWENQLRPDICTSAFSPEEDDYIVRMQGLYGNKWARFARELSERKLKHMMDLGEDELDPTLPFRRTDNQVKNRWYAVLKPDRKGCKRTASQNENLSDADAVETPTKKVRVSQVQGSPQLKPPDFDALFSDVWPTDTETPASETGSCKAPPQLADLLSMCSPSAILMAHEATNADISSRILAKSLDSSFSTSKPSVNKASVPKSRRRSLLCPESLRKREFSAADLQHRQGSYSTTSVNKPDLLNLDTTRKRSRLGPKSAHQLEGSTPDTAYGYFSPDFDRTIPTSSAAKNAEFPLSTPQTQRRLFYNTPSLPSMHISASSLKQEDHCLEEKDTPVKEEYPPLEEKCTSLRDESAPGGFGFGHLTGNAPALTPSSWKTMLLHQSILARDASYWSHPGSRPSSPQYLPEYLPNSLYPTWEEPHEGQGSKE